MEIKEQVKLITGNTNDGLVSLMLDKAKTEVTTYLKCEYSTKFDNVSVDIAVLKINRLGSEGLTSQSCSGAGETYTDGYPQEVLKQLDSFKKKWGAL